MYRRSYSRKKCTPDHRLHIPCGNSYTSWPSHAPPALVKPTQSKSDKSRSTKTQCQKTPCISEEISRLHRRNSLTDRANYSPGGPVAAMPGIPHNDSNTNP